jgi:NAD(P)H-hydrate epimerase
VLPIVTPDEMREIDARAGEPVAVLIERAGAAVARAAMRMLGGSYGRRVVLVAGKGNNGNDGRVAARRLRARGVQVVEVPADAGATTIQPCDLVIDAAYGTGFRGEWLPPDVGDVPVLAVDIPSGVDGLTGAAGPDVLLAERTVTFAALKPGHLLAPGNVLCGALEVADIGLDVGRARAHLVEAADVAAWIPARPVDAHKWRAAVRIVAGSGGMLGAAHLAAGAAQRAGAGIVHLSSPGVATDPQLPIEVVGRPLPTQGWATDVLGSLDRFHALVIGPGLGRGDATALSVREVVGNALTPVVVDGDGLFALAWSSAGAKGLLKGRSMPTVLTPHDGEFSLLAGERTRADRLTSARRLAADTGAVVLLKGAATVVAEPDGEVLVVANGDERLATAGTGDVLSGIIGALLARGVPAFEAAAAGAWLHAEAATRAPFHGMVAGDLAGNLPAVLDALGGAGGVTTAPVRS